MMEEVVELLLSNLRKISKNRIKFNKKLISNGFRRILLLKSRKLKKHFNLIVKFKTLFLNLQIKMVLKFCREKLNLKNRVR